MMTKVMLPLTSNQSILVVTAIGLSYPLVVVVVVVVIVVVVTHSRQLL